MKNPWIVIGAITVLLFGGAIWFGNSVAEKSNEGVVITDHIKGNPDASVVLVEYSDLQCPACASFQPVVKDLLEQYGDAIRFEYKHFPLPIHPYAVQAAVAAEAAGQQGAFYEFHDKLFENQAVWSNSATPNVFFAQYAEELGLNVEQFQIQQKSSLLKNRVTTQFDEGRALNVTGTPTFFLNGEKMNFSTYQEFITQVGVAVDPDLESFPQDKQQSVSEQVNFGL